jgi:probable F420-dependent oxidoreductase
MDLGAVGLWSSVFRTQDAAALPDLLSEIEDLGYSAVWFPGGPADVAFDVARRVLDGSTGLVAATGILSVWSGTVADVLVRHRALRLAHPDRFLLGLGISHPEMVDRDEPGRYVTPIETVSTYLDELDRGGVERTERALAALGPRMLKLAAARTAGAHPYFVPVEHTAFARDTMGPNTLIAPEQAVVFERDPDRARELARRHMQIYLGLSNYVRNLRRLGFTEADVSGGGSDRLVDAIVAWGTVDDIVLRIHDHHAAGADHVCVQVITGEPAAVPLPQWRELGQALNR